MTTSYKKNNKPVIGIAGEVYHKPKDTVFKKYERHFCGDAFVSKIRKAGGIALMIPYIEKFTQEMIYDYISSIDALLLPGGDDIAPILYKEDKLPECKEFDLLLDLFHIALIKETIQQKKPILGICRGTQIINVALGGSLFQDLKYAQAKIKHWDLDNYEKSTHNVTILEKTKLCEFLNTSKLKVNSLHHQSIKKVSPLLIANAVSDDGIIEGIESKKIDQYILGIQWHPETMKENLIYMDKIFNSFINSCK